MNDMMSGVYDDHHKSKSMWKRIAINIFHRMLLDAYILYRRNTDDDQLVLLYSDDFSNIQDEYPFYIFHILS
jgi:hypothetical protein